MKYYKTVMLKPDEKGINSTNRDKSHVHLRMSLYLDF